MIMEKPMTVIWQNHYLSCGMLLFWHPLIMVLWGRVCGIGFSTLQYIKNYIYIYIYTYLYMHIIMKVSGLIGLMSFMMFQDA